MGLQASHGHLYVRNIVAPQALFVPSLQIRIVHHFLNRDKGVKFPLSYLPPLAHIIPKFVFLISDYMNRRYES